MTIVTNNHIGINFTVTISIASRQTLVTIGTGACIIKAIAVWGTGWGIVNERVGCFGKSSWF